MVVPIVGAKATPFVSAGVQVYVVAPVTEIVAVFPKQKTGTFELAAKVTDGEVPIFILAVFIQPEIFVTVAVYVPGLLTVTDEEFVFVDQE